MRAQLPTLRSAVEVPLRQIIKMQTDEDGRRRASVIEQSESLAAQLFDVYKADDAPARAQKHGREANAQIAIWWPLSVFLAKHKFLAEAKRLSSLGRKGVPTLADLENVFANRRAGLAAARDAARTQLEKLQEVST
jgi:hypothetical protein